MIGVAVSKPKVRALALLLRSICAIAIFVLVASPLQARESSEVTVAKAPFDAAAAWSEFEDLLRREYAYIERDDIDVEAQLARSKIVALQAQNRATFRRVIHQTALTFMDPHLIVGPFADDDYAIVMTSADLGAKFHAGKLIIADVRAGSPAFSAGIRPGDEVLAIDGNAPLVAAQLPFGSILPEPTAAQLNYGAVLAINGKRAGSRSLQLRSPNGKSRVLQLISTREYANSLDDRPPVSVRWVGNDSEIAVIRINNSLGTNDTIAAFDDAIIEVMDAKAVVLDMRDTPSGGNTEVARSIIGHFTTQIRPYQIHEIPALEREFSVPRRFVEYVYPRNPYYDGQVYVLHGRWTGSMGEGVVIGMDAATEAVTVGSNMGDLLGGLWNRNLEKSDARVDLGGEALFHVDGTPRADYVADIVVAPADIDADGHDPTLAQVLRLHGSTE